MGWSFVVLVGYVWNGPNDCTKTLKFKVATSNNDSFAHWLMINSYASRMVSENFTDGWN